MKTYLKNITLLLLTILFLASCTKMEENSAIDDYNVSWTEKSKIASDAMPLGNGTTGALVSVLEDGHIWVSVRHVDAWSEAHRLLKLGDLEITVTPNPFATVFKQKLILSQGVIHLEGENGFKSKIWIDANNEVIHIENNAANAFQLDVKLHNWRDQAKIIREENLAGIPNGVEESADVIVDNDKNALIWYHRNSSTKAFDWAMKALEIPMPINIHNVLANRTFGAWVSGDKMIYKNKTDLTSEVGKKNHLTIHTLVNQPENAEEWLSELGSTVLQKQNLNKNWNNHIAWWQHFWKKSFIHLSGTNEAEITSAGYAYAMYLNAMAGEGEFPIIWNGSIFAPALSEVPQRNHTGFRYFEDPDHRSWGNLMLHQNLRLPYYSMFAAGQFEYSKPFLDVYMRGFDLMKAHTKTVFGHEGTVIRESTTLWGVIAPGVYGVNREGLEPGQQKNIWHRTHWNAGLEVAYFMADYFDYTQNEKFATDTLIPFANEIVKFFDLHWPHRNEKLYFPHVLAMETFRDTDNPMPLVAGMYAVLNSLLELPNELSCAEDRTYWEELLDRLPGIPLRHRNGKMILANAEKVYSQKANVEVSELYAVFPYQLYCVGKPDLEIAQETYRNRTILVDDVGEENPGWASGHLRGGWRQESVMAAMIGLTDSVKKEVVWALHRPVPEQRFPGFFKSTYDGVPDVQHSSMAATALQRMILQDVKGKIILLPAFPAEWNCNFKLFAKQNTFVEGKIELGKIVELKVAPMNRKKDIYMGQNLEKPEDSIWK